MDFIDKRKPIMSYMGGYYTSTNMIVFASLHNFTALWVFDSFQINAQKDFDEKYHYVSAGTNHKPKQIMTINWPILEKVRIL